MAEFSKKKKKNDPGIPFVCPKTVKYQGSNNRVSGGDKTYTDVSNKRQLLLVSLLHYRIYIFFSGSWRSRNTSSWCIWSSISSVRTNGHSHSTSRCPVALLLCRLYITLVHDIRRCMWCLSGHKVLSISSPLPDECLHSGDVLVVNFEKAKAAVRRKFSFFKITMSPKLGSVYDMNSDTVIDVSKSPYMLINNTRRCSDLTKLCELEKYADNFKYYTNLIPDEFPRDYF